MSKYGAIRTNGFSSKLEASVYQMLELRLKANEIAEIMCQDHVRVCCDPFAVCSHKQKIEYLADFKCIRENGTIFWVEAKGFETAVWKIKKRLWMHYGPGPLEIWGGHHSRPTLLEVIE